MMNKFTMVLGAAAVATLAGCKDPDYVRAGAATQNDVKNADTTIVDVPATPGAHADVTAPSAVEPIVVKPIAVEPMPQAKAKPVEPEVTTYVVQSGDYLAKISKKFNVTISSIRRLNPSIKKDVIRVGQKIKLPGKLDVGVQAVPSKSAKATVAKGSAKKVYQSYKGETKEYVVKSGDTLGSVAYGNGCNIRQLKELNGLTKDSLRVGQKLKVPVGGAAKKPVAKAEAKPAVVAEKKAVEAPKAAPAAAPVAEQPAESAAPAAPAAEAPAAAPAEPAEKPAAAAPAAAPAPATTTYAVQEGDDITGVSIRWGVSAAEIRELNNLGEGDQLVPGQIIKLPADAQQ